MSLLVGLTGLHLENESTGAKYGFVRVGWGAIMCACLCAWQLEQESFLF